MTNLWNDHPLLVVIGVIAVLLLLWLMLRPRQRVTLSDNVPLRPHMSSPADADRLSTAPAAVIGDKVSALLHDNLPPPDGHPDDLLLLKGVGPKLASLLNQRGLSRFDQIAKLSDGQVEALDVSLGAFRGRFTRDRIVEQACYLARGDRDGFEQSFGKL